ncbi:MAG: hypothetical protein A2005_08435 [Desulfuromonadales bacterium GWC2_61_20]|nr:MAG: hypothetical protein A2005_08435 [Desulfuromonadales bacterium GWC2_61_20]HAD05451.1 pilus assembly protein [Desulfuromonas sp.]
MRITLISDHLLQYSRRNRGFTLVELMITIGVAGILLSFAVPTFLDVVKNNRLRTDTATFAGALNLARSEAIRRSQQVSVCISSNGTSCITSGGWEQGWLVFADVDQDEEVDTAADIIRVFRPLAPGVTLRTTATFDDYISYNATGVSQGAAVGNGTFRVCDDRGVPRAYGVIVNITGRVRTTTVDAEVGSCP